jgi:hypothetical protein
VKIDIQIFSEPTSDARFNAYGYKFGFNGKEYGSHTLVPNNSVLGWLQILNDLADTLAHLSREELEDETLG